MKTHPPEVLNRVGWSALLAGLLLLLPAAARAQCQLQRYWPLNDGDSTSFSDPSLGSAGDSSLSTSANGDGFTVAQTTSAGTAYMYFYYSGDQLLLSEIDDPGLGDLVFDEPLIFLEEAILNNPGSVSSSSTCEFDGVTVDVTFDVSTARAGTVIVPAGSYTNCLTFTINLTASAEGHTESEPLSGFVLAPGVGAVKQALYTASGSTAVLAGWSVLTGGNVGGVPVADLVPLSGLTVPVFTLQPKSTTATNNGFTILRAATTGGSVQYQWQFNGIDLSDGGEFSGSTSSNLVINPVSFSDAGVYSVSIVNPACSGVSTNAYLTVVPDTTPPVVSITNLPAGLSVSNAAFTVKGAASDNIAVSSVLYSLNGGAWVAASATTTNWSNWSAPVTLAPGTNIVLAYAVDTSGNDSKTVTNKVTYVVSALLTVRTNQTGWGSLSPSLNNASLAVNQNYTLTATAKTGFQFANWTGAAGLLTNSPTLTFAMQPNLALTANFVDITKPVISITNVPAGFSVSNQVFIVKGTASDNVAVSNVLYSLNGAGWVSASATTTNWSNWSAQVILTPGTNSIAAYAVDTSGNASLTASNKVAYVVSALLTVRTNQPGWGGISPNLNNASLALNQNYKLTATAATGFQFVNWTGAAALLTNSPTLTFAMQPNLALTANFADITKPVLTITNVPAGSSVSNQVFIVKGTAGDNVAVSNVLYSLNGAGWVSASATTPNWSNWSAQVILTPGTNTLAAYAVDTSGNASPTASNKVTYVVSALLTVRTNQPAWGGVSPNLNNASLAVNQNYTLTATAKTGFQFTNWTSNLGWVSNSASLTFKMQANLVLTANFADVIKPVISITNVPAGLTVSNQVFTVKGTAGDNAAVASVTYQLNGGGWQTASTGNGWTNWFTPPLTLVPGTNVIQAYAVDTSGNLSATVTNKVNYVFALGGTWNVAQFMTPGQITWDAVNGLQGGANFSATNGTLTLNPNGTLSGQLGNPFTGYYSLGSNGLVNTEILTENSTNDYTLFLNASQDTLALADTDAAQNEQELMIFERAPAASTFASLAGSWNMVQYDTPSLLAGNPALGLAGGDNFSATNGTMTMQSNGTFSGSLGGAFTGSYALGGNGLINATVISHGATNRHSLFVNASQDTLTEVEIQTNNTQQIMLMERAPASVSKADLAGLWNVASFTTPAQMTLGASSGLQGGGNFGVNRGTMTLDAGGNVSGNVNGAFTGTLTIGSSGVITAAIISDGQTNRHTLFLNAGKDTMTSVDTKFDANDNSQEIILFQRAPQ